MRRKETNGRRNARVSTTRESPGKWTRTSNLSHGTATTEPLETSTSRHRSPFSLSRPAPDTPTACLTSLYPIIISVFVSQSCSPFLAIVASFPLVSSPSISFSQSKLASTALFFLLHSLVLSPRDSLCPQVYIHACVRDFTHACIYTCMTPSLS